MKKLLEDYEKLRTTLEGKHDLALPELKECAVSWAEYDTPSGKSLNEKVTTLEQTRPGWSRRQSNILVCPDRAEQDGQPIVGEWLLDEHTSVILPPGSDPLPPRKDQLVKISEGGKGNPCLIEERQLRRHKGGKLHYRIYWGAPDEDTSALTPVACRFTGFN